MSTDRTYVLLEEYKRMHKKGHFKGIGCFNYYWQIQQLVRETQAKTLLDYGCGKGRQFTARSKVLHAKLGVYIDSWAEGLGVETILGYDPAVEKYAICPTQLFDGVYCCSVLEHLYEEQIFNTLNDIFAHAQKFVFLVIGTVPAKKNLPSGQNAHVTIQPQSWWDMRIRQVAEKYPAIHWVTAEERDKPIYMES